MNTALLKANPALKGAPKKMVKALLSTEARRRASGDWGPWITERFPPGSVGRGWAADITEARRNKVFAVLVRDVGHGVVHLGISSLSGRRPSWHEMQRIKDELAGPDATAIEVYPPHDEIVDDADMFHLWVLPGPLPFSLAR
jgi:hypothetical protein